MANFVAGLLTYALILAGAVLGALALAYYFNTDSGRRLWRSLGGTGETKETDRVLDRDVDLAHVRQKVDAARATSERISSSHPSGGGDSGGDGGGD